MPLVNVASADACDLIRGPRHDRRRFLIGETGKNKFRAESATNVVEVLGVRFPRVRINMNNPSVVANPAKAAAKPVDTPWLTEAVDKHGGHSIGTTPGHELREEVIESGNGGYRSRPSSTAADLRSPLHYRVAMHLVPGQGYHVCSSQSRESCKPQPVTPSTNSRAFGS